MYATARAKIYCETGFGLANIPDTPAVLEEAAGGRIFDCGVVNCLPLEGQGSGEITIQARPEMDFADYLSLDYDETTQPPGFGIFGRTYWIITGYRYNAADCITVSLVLDPWLTLGGYPAVTAISGVYDRHTTATDNFGEYDQPDPFLVPSQPLIIRNIMPLKIDFETKTIILATFHLGKLGYYDLSALAANYGADSAAVTIPQVPQLVNSDKTEIVLGTENYTLPAVCAFDGDSEEVRLGIARARSIGVEAGIIAQYEIPATLTLEINDYGLIKKITGEIAEDSLDLLPFEYATVNNKKILYGDNNKIKIVSKATSEQTEYPPEQIRGTDDYGAALAAPVFCTFSDPRAHGRPYAFPKFYQGAQQFLTGLISFISGMEWQSAPLVYTYGSGASLQGQFFAAETQNQVTAARENYDLSQRQTLENTAVSTISSTLVQGLSGNIAGAIAGAAGGLAQGLLTAHQLEDSFSNAQNQYARSRSLEQAQMIASNYVIAPSITFPASEALRDFTGNGFGVYQITPSDSDLERLDIIANMYGYKDAGTPLTNDSFRADHEAAKYYVYIQAKNVMITMGGHYRKRYCELLSAMFSAGVRIWKRRPAGNLYKEDNRN